MKQILKSKIHRAHITGINPDYIGSITIDKDLMDKAGIVPYEKVLIANVANSNRWETYVIMGEAGSGVIEVQGAGAKICKKGDVVIILAFEITDEPLKPKMILVDEKNKFMKYL